MPAEYIANIFPFKSIKSKYAGIRYRWVCPECATSCFSYILPKINQEVNCVHCGGAFRYIEREFKNEAKKINLKEL